MTDKETPPLEGDAEKAARGQGYKTLDDTRFAHAKFELELEERGLRNKMAGDVRWMRFATFIVAIITPIALSLWLLPKLYDKLRMLMPAEMQAGGVAMSSLSAPLTALVVGTFASFIIVYSALLVGVFRGESRESKTMSDVNSAISTGQKVLGNDG